MSYTIYSSEASFPITYQWKCSKCGTINRASTRIVTRGQTTSPGRAANPQAQHNASVMARSQMGDIVKPLFGENCYFHQYKKLGLDQQCGICSHKEPWAVYNGGWAESINKLGLSALVIDAIVFGVMVFLLIFGKHTDQQRTNTIQMLLITFGIAALLVGSCILYIRISSNYEEKKDYEISRQSKTSLPVLVLDDEPVIDFEAIEQMEEAQKKREEEQKHHVTVSPQDNPIQQEEKSTPNDNPVVNSNSFSAADEIEKSKGLLDKGIITQEEFEAKKKQLLGL